MPQLESVQTSVLAQQWDGTEAGAAVVEEALGATAYDAVYVKRVKSATPMLNITQTATHKIVTIKPTDYAIVDMPSKTLRGLSAAAVAAQYQAAPAPASSTQSTSTTPASSSTASGSSAASNAQPAPASSSSASASTTSAPAKS